MSVKEASPALSNGLAERQAKLHRLREEEGGPFPHVTFPGRVPIATVDVAEAAEGHPSLDSPVHRIAGRVRARRKHGGVCFADVWDESGSLELCARVDELGEESYKRFRDFDVGDIIGVDGRLGSTRRGEPILVVSDYVLMAKALRQPPALNSPESPGGLSAKGVDRVFDLMADDDVREMFRLRARTTTAIRSVMDDQGFTEVETPILQGAPGGASARPFVTHVRSLDRTMSLRISPQLYLRRCLVGGLERVFDLGKCFRNEGISYEHSPEFTLVEWSMSYCDYRDAASFAELLIKTVAEQVLGTTTIERGGRSIDLGAPWRRCTLPEAIEEVTGLDCVAATNAELAEALDEPVAPDASWGALVNLLYAKLVEPNLFEPTIVFDFPIEAHSLVKGHATDPRLGEAFDIVIGGMEVASGDSELNDPEEQEARFQALGADENGDEYDAQILTALEYGLAPSAGAGFGLERVLLLLSGCEAIRDVIPFPALSGRR